MMFGTLLLEVQDGLVLGLDSPISIAQNEKLLFPNPNQVWNESRKAASEIPQKSVPNWRFGTSWAFGFPFSFANKTIHHFIHV
jgi:hypothetical protein